MRPCPDTEVLSVQVILYTNINEKILTINDFSAFRYS